MELMRDAVVYIEVPASPVIGNCSDAAAIHEKVQHRSSILPMMCVDQLFESQVETVNQLAGSQPLAGAKTEIPDDGAMVLFEIPGHIKFSALKLPD
jgi:hypothetical protein